MPRSSTLLNQETAKTTSRFRSPPPSPLYLPCRAPVLRRRVRIREEMEEDMALQTTGCKALPGPLPAPYRRTHGKPMTGSCQ